MALTKEVIIALLGSSEAHSIFNHLVAAWLFTEGSGTSVADSSINANTMTLMADNAAPNPGHYAWVGVAPECSIDIVGDSSTGDAAGGYCKNVSIRNSTNNPNNEVTILMVCSQGYTLGEVAEGYMAFLPWNGSAYLGGFGTFGATAVDSDGPIRQRAGTSTFNPDETTGIAMDEFGFFWFRGTSETSAETDLRLVHNDGNTGESERTIAGNFYGDALQNAVNNAFALGYPTLTGPDSGSHTLGGDCGGSFKVYSILMWDRRLTDIEIETIEVIFNGENPFSEIGGMMLDELWSGNTW